MSTSAKVRAAALPALAYTLLAMAYTWPLPVNLAQGVAHDAGDPILNAWILWWSTQAVPLTTSWWNAPIFHPAAGTLAFSEHLLGLAPIAAPVIALTGNPLLGYNVTLIATYILSALGGYFLGYTLTRRHDAAFVAGIAFGFAPYRLAQVPHIQVLSAYWTPACLAALHRYDRERRPRWIGFAAFAWLAQALSCGYYLFFLSALLALWLLWFAVGRWPLRALGHAALAFGAAALMMAPVLWNYRLILNDTYGFHRSLDEIRLFSADAAGLLLASEDLLTWGWLHVIQRPESSLFPGLAVLALAAFAIYSSRPFRVPAGEAKPVRLFRIACAAILVLLLVATVLPIANGGWRLTLGGLRLISIATADKPLALAVAAGLTLILSLPGPRAAIRRRSPLAFYLLATLVMWILALGPEPTFMNRQALTQGPYAWLMWLPGFDSLRVPARFWMMAVACLSVVASLSVNRLEGRGRRVLLALSVTGLLLDGWPRTFVVLAAPAARPAPEGVATRLDLPVTDDTGAAALYQQTIERVPLHNGFSGYFAPHYYPLRALLEARDSRILDVLASSGPLGIVIHHHGDPDGALRRLVLAHPGAALVRTDGDWSSYRIPAAPAAPLFPDRQGSPLGIKSLATFPSPPHAVRALDGDLRTRWSGGVQQQSAEATIELEAATHVGQVVIDLGAFSTDFAARLRIDVSADGVAWATAWIGDTALHAYYAAVRHPREVPLVFPLNRDGVRFIRLSQVGFGPRDWSIAELHVLR